MSSDEVILNNFLISLEQDSHIFDGRLTVEEYINLKTALASGIKALGERRPHGEWIPCNIRNIKDVYKCSICSWFKNYTPCFCENCGADMRKEGKAE